MVVAGALCAALIVVLPFLDGIAQLFVAGVLGFTAGLAFVIWTVGDVRSLPYLWGARGEQWTADLLASLDHEVWSVRHDVEAKRGNWDHIVDGPSGVFLLDSKNFSKPTWVRNDALVSGSRRIAGVRFRAAAAELSEMLGNGGRGPWVRPVVVIWGNFSQRLVETGGVVYLAADELIPWLEGTLRQRQYPGASKPR